MGRGELNQDGQAALALRIKSYLVPDAPPPGFQMGEYFSLHLPAGTTVKELTAKLFGKRAEQVGVVAVNGKLASDETVLSPGDAVDVYPLMEGG